VNAAGRAWREDMIARLDLRIRAYDTYARHSPIAATTMGALESVVRRMQSEIDEVDLAIARDTISCKLADLDDTPMPAPFTAGEQLGLL
jgi:hypothetical protein